MERRGGAGRAVTAGIFLAIALVAAGAAYVAMYGAPGADRGAVPQMVVLAAVCAGEDGGLQTPVVTLIDTISGEVTPLDPLATVTIPGTSYDNLRDAYAFGGGPAVAAAVGRLTGADEPAYVVLDADAWVTAVDAAGGATVVSPRAVDVFTGEQLFTFPPGPQTLSGADTCEYLKGTAYFADNERERVAEQFAAVAVTSVTVIDAGTAGVSTDLSDEAFANLRAILQ